MPLLLLLLAVATYASSVWNGKADTAWHSESETEFTITTAEQLAGFAVLVNGGNSFEGKTVKLGSNIMLNDTANWQNWASSPPVNEWVAIGGGGKENDINKPFNGIFDGNGFAVRGVYINSAKFWEGFFGLLDSNAAIKKIGVVASYIKGNSMVGGLVGYNCRGMISDSYFAGTVIASGSGDVGGLVGDNGKEKSVIINSYSSGEIIGEDRIGGLVGINGGTISGSYSTSKVTGNRFNIGGLIGTNYGTVISSYSTGAVTGKEYVGGLVGKNYDVGGNAYGTVSNSYSTGKVTGEENVGGLVGYNSSGIISNSYSSSEVVGKKYSIGGLVGINSYGLIINSYSFGNVAGGIDKATKEMQSKEFVDSLNFMAGLLSVNAWVYSPGKYPILSEQAASWPNMDKFFAGGNGTEANPYIISTKKHLENLAYFVNLGANFLGKHFKLSQNISFKSPFAKWTPIGKKLGPFEGTFDGNGFTVSGISRSSGLFGVLGSNSTIKNLGVINVDIEDGGGLARYNKGTIINSYSTGKVSGKYGYLGGLVGCNCGDSSRIINSYSTASVSGLDDVGGLVGINTGNISGSYSSGKVKGTAFALRLHGNKDAGGLVGDNEGTIINSHSSSDVTGQWDVGGLVGTNTGTINNSYSSGNVNGSLHVGGIAGVNGGTVSGCYFTGKLKGGEDVGEIVGSGKEAVDSYYGKKKQVKE